MEANDFLNKHKFEMEWNGSKWFKQMGPKD